MFYSLVNFGLLISFFSQSLSNDNFFFLQYGSIPEFLYDIRKMFRNCLKFHEKGSEFYNHGKSLEEFLDNFLEQWLPDYAYETHPTFIKIKPQQPEPSTSGTGKKRKKKH